MGNIEIKGVKQRKIELLQEISRQIYFEAFSDFNSAGDMAKYLGEAYSIEKLTTELKGMAGVCPDMQIGVEAGQMRYNLLKIT